MPEQDPKRRKDRHFRPGGGSGSGAAANLALEPRLLLSVAHRGKVPAAVQSHAQPTARVTPTAEINAAYASFLNDFAVVEHQYVKAINDQASGTVSVSANVTQVYTGGSSTMVVDDATVFGPANQFSAPVVTTATIGGIPIGSQYVFTGRLNGTTLVVDTTASSQTSLPAGVVLSANVPATSQTSAAAIFPSFVSNRTNLMGIQLVQYFNNLPLKLPYFNAAPHTPNSRGAIQNYVYSSVAGGDPTSLQQAILSIPLPTTAGPDLTIYNAAVVSAVEQSRIQTLNGISQIYAGRLKVSAPAPNNRFGVVAPKTIPAYILGTGTGTATG